MSEQNAQTQHYLITRFKIEDDFVRLWPKGLQYPELTLFDISDLQDAGVNWQEVERGVEHPCRFLAYYVLSDKTKSSGNPYKDVVHLEPVGASTPEASIEAGAIVGELRAIKALLIQIIDRIAPNRDGEPQAARPQRQQPEPSDLSETLFGPEETDLVAPTTSNNGAGNPTAPTEDPDRTRFYDLVATAITEGQVQQDDVDAILAAGYDWSLAARCLEAEAGRAGWSQEQRGYRQEVVGRLEALLDAPQVRAGLVEPGLEEGWQYLTATEALIEEGKRVKGAIEAAEPAGEAEKEAS